MVRVDSVLGVPAVGITTCERSDAAVSASAGPTCCSSHRVTAWKGKACGLGSWGCRLHTYGCRLRTHGCRPNTYGCRPILTMAILTTSCLTHHFLPYYGDTHYFLPYSLLPALLWRYSLLPALLTKAILTMASPGSLQSSPSPSPSPNPNPSPYSYPRPNLEDGLLTRNKPCPYSYP